MATIKSQMTLNDGMSGVLKKITNALDITLASFEQVQRASGNAMDVTEIEAARGALVGASSAVDELAENYRRAAQEEEKLNQSINQGASAMDGLLGKVTSMVAAYASLSKVKDFAVDAMGAADVQIGAQVQLKTVMGNMGSLDYYDQVLSKANEIQSRGMYGDEAMIAGAGELATYFSDGDAILSMMDTLTNYAAGMSNGGAVDASAMVDYATGIGKIMSGSYDAMSQKGFKFSEAQKAIIEGVANEAQIVAELGAEYVNLSEEMQAAAVIGDIINEGWGGLYEAVSNTPFGLIRQLNGALGDVQETVGVGIYPAVLGLVGMVQSNLPQIESAAMSLATVLGFAITVLTGMTEGAISFGTAVADNWGWIGPIVYGIAAGLAIYAGYLGALQTAQLASAAAQWVMNAAMTASPITWVVVGVIALITVLYAAVGAVNHFAGTSVSATGLIAGAFAVLGAHVINTFVVPFWNGLTMVANFLGNVFNNPAAAVEILIYDMALTVVGYIANMAAAIEAVINKIPGVTVDITSGLDGFYSQLEQAQQAVKDQSGWVEYVAKMDYIDYSDAANAGYAFGQGIEDKIGGFFGGFGYEPGSIEDFTNNGFDGFMMDGLGNDVGTIADNTSGMAGALEVSGEELKYLRDIAERDAINRFTTAEVKIDMTGMTNKIDSNMDLDGVIRELTDGFAESLVTAAEGVHE